MGNGFQVGRVSVLALIGAVAMALAWFAAIPDRSGATGLPRSCGWILEPTASSQNILFPDTATEYLGAEVPVPPGGSIEITGEYPHSRYMSLQAYSNTLQTTTDLRDTQIVPDPGSTNPFFAGANRNATHRNYTVRILSGEPPSGGGPPNTLYDTSPTGQGGHAFAYRIYLADKGAGQFGGVPAPSITLVLANGTKIALPSCSAPPSDALLTSTLANAGLADYYLPAAGLLAQSTPTWHKYVNAANGYGIFATGGEHIPAAVAAAVAELTAKLPAGLGENADNKYVFSDLSREFGEVVEFRAKLPTTPHTFAGEPRMGKGQLRYWSMCTGTSGSQTLGCTVDEQTPVDRRGYFTVAISTAADRPADATTACGVTWLPWGPAPEGLALMRNMLPAADFRQAIQNAAPGTEKATLGAYYPVGRYFATPQAFATSVGCHRS